MDPTILDDSNNTLVHLRPYPIVAKVGTTPLAGRADGLRRELQLLMFLAAADAPTVRPATIVPPGPHDQDGLLVILLNLAVAVSEEPSPASRAHALDAVHAALVDFHDPLPGYLDAFADTAAVVADPNATPTLSTDDRAFLAWAHEELLSRVPPHVGAIQALHGDPWVGNMTSTARGPLLLDFEAACSGPVEWDWSPLPERLVEYTHASLDAELLSVCWLLRSLIVTTWCWSQPGRAPEVDEAAAWHLAVLHERLH
jgi:hypothetical protein